MTKRLTLCLLLLALLVNFGFGFARGIGRPMTSDSFYFLKIACSVAEGDGYRLREGFWPNSPTMTRSPGWPLTVSLALRVVRFVSPDVTMRVLCLLLNALNSVLLALLAFRAMGQVRVVGVIGGMLYLGYPTALYLAYEGASEILFVTLVASGSLLLMSGGVRRMIGFLLMGLAAFGRPNFVLWLPLFALLLVFAGSRCRDLLTRRNFLHFALCSLLFVLPSLIWAVRNYAVCGRFPILSTLRGEVFYGANNPMTAETLEYWGYWVFPGEIPGEKSMRELSTTMSEDQVDHYYFARGKEYVRAHWFSMPRLLLGKLVRGYVPIPWKPGWQVYAASACRWLLYILFLTGVCFFWQSVTPAYRIVLPAMILTSVFTTLIFWGCARFAFAVEPFLMPVAAVVLGRLISHE